MRWISAAALFLLTVLPALAEKPVPFLAGRVVDEAAMIPADTKRQIEDKLAAFEQRTGDQVVVLTVDSLDGEPIEDFSVRVAQTWKLGQKGKDNGVLLVVAKQDRKIRIDVGYGLEPTLTDLETSRIIDLMRPDFQKGDFGAGIARGTDAILTALDGGELPAQPAGQPEGKGLPAGGLLIFLVVIGAFSLIALTTRGFQSWFLYLFLMPFYGLAPAFTGLSIGVAGLVAWVIGFPILKFLLSHTGLGQRFTSRSSRGPWGGWGGGGFGGGGFGGGGFSGGGGGGGFSGGGGSFGGGGASGSW